MVELQLHIIMNCDCSLAAFSMAEWTKQVVCPYSNKLSFNPWKTIPSLESQSSKIGLHLLCSFLMHSSLVHFQLGLENFHTILQSCIYFNNRAIRAPLT